MIFIKLNTFGKKSKEPLRNVQRKNNIDSWKTVIDFIFLIEKLSDRNLIREETIMIISNESVLTVHSIYK